MSTHSDASLQPVMTSTSGRISQEGSQHGPDAQFVEIAETSTEAEQVTVTVKDPFRSACNTRSLASQDGTVANILMDHSGVRRAKFDVACPDDPLSSIHGEGTADDPCSSLGERPHRTIASQLKRAHGRVLENALLTKRLLCSRPFLDADRSMGLVLAEEIDATGLEFDVEDKIRRLRPLPSRRKSRRLSSKPGNAQQKRIGHGPQSSQGNASRGTRARLLHIDGRQERNPHSSPSRAMLHDSGDGLHALLIRWYHLPELYGFRYGMQMVF